VDVDDKDTCAALEAHFPVLTSVPCEQTTKGRHYYFKRSAKADRYGYFDGRAQVLPGVDFKTTCKSGTSGFIVVSPSQGKAWLRAPWDVPTIEIPDALLYAVARPHFCTVNAVLTFPDGTRLAVHKDPWLPRCDYIAPLFEDSDCLIAPANGTIPIGIGTATVMEELLWMCEHRRLRRWPTDLAAIRQMADFLGMPSCIYTLLSTWHPSSPVARTEALDRVCPAWASTAVEPGVLVDLASLKGPLAFVPLQRDQQWLFHDKDAALPTYVDDVLRPNPIQYARDSLPAPVLELLERYPNLLLAGGAALSIATDCVTEGSDFDLFLWGADAAAAEAVRRDLVSSDGVTVSAQTGAAITVVWGPDEEVIQLITWLFDSPEHVLDSFDIAPSRVALGCFGEPGNLQLHARTSWVEALRHMTFWVDTGSWSEASVARILKYYAKGFDVVVPGLNRKALQVRDPVTFKVQRGISNLFKVEALVEKRACPFPSYRRLAGRPIDTARPSYDTLHSMLRNTCGNLYKTSAYAELIPVGILARVTKLLAHAGRTWTGLGRTRGVPKHSSTRQPLERPVWQHAPKNGNLYPSSPRCAAAFKYKVLAEQAAARTGVEGSPAFLLTHLDGR
jgi:hypothetical protein